MKFREYVVDQRYFFVFYGLILSFASILAIAALDGERALGYVLYLNGSCLLFLVVYVATDYFYRNNRYKQIAEQAGSEQHEIYMGTIEARNCEQKLYLSLLRKIQDDYFRQLRRLQDEKRDQHEFILSWIHEVKLPIAASRLLMENCYGKSVDWLVDKMEDELDKIDHCVERALFYSRADSFSKDYFIAETNVNQLIKNSAKKYAKLFINKKVRLDMEERDQSVHSDHKWLGFVIDQIMSNALKYVDEGGTISVRFKEDRKEKRVRIQDDGMGIKAEDLHRVFEKGFTGATGRSHRKSTGLGLYLARQLANKLGHEIAIDSEEGKFTTVTIHFPKNGNHYRLSDE